ncbi:MAG: hypothetical protein M0042_01070 [Nitrospiraceae bacterium]|nr:hypothetical protein [Nitrospiraceae bacterium]
MDNFQQYDIISIRRVNRQFTLDECKPGGRTPEVGDEATIIEVYANPGLGYELECVSKSGETEWLISISPDDLDMEVVGRYPALNDANCALLKTTTRGVEAISIVGLLEAHNIKASTISEGTSPVSGRLDGSLPLYKIFVAEEMLTEARRLIASQNTENDREWSEYKKNEERKGKIGGRILCLLGAIFFYLLPHFSSSKADPLIKYAMQAAALFFVLLLVFSFYEGKAGSRR